MEPRIQYTKTSDGVNIAYAAVGSGPPFVIAATIWGTLHMAQIGINTAGFWSIAELQTLGCTVFVYDARATGSSDRAVADCSLQARVRDLEAVVLSAGAKDFPLFGFGHGAATAVAYTADHPAEVEQLILANPFVSGAEYYSTNPALRALKATESMAEAEWDYFTRSLAFGVLRFDDPDAARKIAHAFQSGMRPTDLFKFRAAAESTNIAELLARIAVPTLVVRDDSVAIGNELARNVAAGIPGAQFVVADCKTTVRDYLRVSAEPAPSDRWGSPTMAVILFADIVDSTALTERIGDAAFRTKARDLDDALRKIITDNGGTPIDGKLLGDGVLATFPAASQAIAAALACEAACDGTPLKLHLGLHAGDVIRERDNVFGGAVNLASRICALSQPGEILVSATVRDLARTSAGVQFDDRGDHDLKGIADPIRVFAVR